ncbi:hypothetical protein Goshw_029608 [Gossypium schwendimanii]|uniref:PUB2-4-like N-terminal domain-containing protein n=1 Tax=Gossypium schwendimanii TaxID=34291 RepID=A0A7J9KZR8_GOSSC|nr:hypothetical protein [Gossypium schwendimanii]
MKMSLLETLLRGISFFLNFSSSENINSEPVQKYYQGAEEILKVLKPIILNAIFDSEITSDEVLSKAFEELGVSVEELLQQFERWQPLSSKAYFVLQVESLISEIRNSCLDIFRVLKSSHQHLPYELSSASLEVIYKPKLLKLKLVFCFCIYKLKKLQKFSVLINLLLL